MSRQTIAPKMRTVIQYRQNNGLDDVFISSEVQGFAGWSMVDLIWIPERFIATGVKQPSWNSQRFQADMREIAR
jgi:hypothetical protein